MIVDRRFRGAYCLHHQGNDHPTSETSAHFNVTARRYIPEDSKLHTRRHENLKSHIFIFVDEKEIMHDPVVTDHGFQVSYAL
jgi:hypothetical protein